MTDILERAESDRNWIERIADRVPGFSGYLKREMRREVDRLWRGHLARRVDGIRATLGSKIRDLSRQGSLDAIRGLDGIDKGLDGLANRIRTADSGYSGFFDAVKVKEKELDEVYRFDLEFDDAVAVLESRIESLGQPSGPSSDDLRRAIEEAESRWRQRAELLDLAIRPR